jgi:CRP-like cAMP-binding protein
MFFLIRGVVEAVSKNGGGPRQTLQSGSFFGEESMLYTVPHKRSFHSVTSCDVLVISKLKMEVVMRDYPHIAEKIKQVRYIQTFNVIFDHSVCRHTALLCKMHSRFQQCTVWTI